MLHIEKVGNLKFPRISSEYPGPSQTLEFSDIVELFKRRIGTIAFSLALALLLGATYLYTAPRYFSASARIFLDARNVQQLELERRTETIDNSSLESQVELVSSENVLLPVLQKMNLADDPGFLNPPRDFFSRMLGILVKTITEILSGKTGGPAEAGAKRNAAFGILAQNLEARRVGATSVLSITYHALRPEQAAEIVNAIADAYIQELVRARFEAAQRANTWMQERLGQLREQANAASKAVQQFKTANNIVDTNRGRVEEQQISEMITQIVLTRSQEEEAKARVDRVEAILKSGTIDGTVTDALRVDVISRLRQQLLDASMKEADISARFGLSHQVAVQARNEVAQLRRSLQSELQRIAETFKSDYDIAKSRRESLQRALADLTRTQGLTNQSRVRLSELESAAQTYSALYESSLKRQTDMSDHQSFPLTEARIITRGIPPLASSRPSKFMILAIALTGGGIIGFGLALVRDSLDPVFRTPDQLERFTGFRCVAVIPWIRMSNWTYRTNFRRRPGKDSLLAPGPMSYAMEAPFSAFTEGIRSMKVAIDLANEGNNTAIIGITSSVPAEGKSTLSANLAQMIARSGQRCLLIDADLRNPSLTRAAMPNAEIGLAEMLAGKVNVESIPLMWSSDNLAFLPARNVQGTAEPIGSLSSSSMKLLLEKVAARFDYVIVDLPPMAPLVDVRAVSPLLHKIMIVSQWGSTEREVLRQAIDRNGPEHHSQILGLILNKVPKRVLRRYPTYRSDTYLHDNETPHQPRHSVVT